MYQMSPTGHPALDPTRLADLPPAERRVAEYLVGSAPESLLLSAAAVADVVGTSNATVVRTAKGLGFAGLGDLRRAIAAVQVSRHPPNLARVQATLTSIPRNQVLSAMVSNQMRRLEELRTRVTPDHFEKAVVLLNDARQIVWQGGVGPTAYLAEYASLMCVRTGRPSIAFTAAGIAAADDLVSLTESDVVVVLAYGRTQKHVSVLIDRATDIGCATILMADHSDRRLGRRVTLVLERGIENPEFFTSHINTLALIEALIAGLAVTDPTNATAAVASLNNIRAALNGERFDVDWS